MLVFSGFVAGSFSLGHIVANDIHPMVVTTLRFVVAACIMTTIAVASGKLRWQHFASPWRYAVLGGLMASYFVLMFEGLKTAQPLSMSAVFTLTPAMSAVFAYFLLAQIGTKRIALALIIGAIGALWVIFRADIAAFLAFNVGKGELIFLAGCACHAFYTPLVRRLNRGEPLLAFAALTILGALVVMTILSMPQLLVTDFAALPMIAWITVAYVAIFATAATFFLVQFATMRLPSSKVMAYTYLIPSWVIEWEIALRQQWPPVLIVPGIALTMLALTLLLRKEGHKPSK
jgi:drug/metabolite transporter (DMT)-like permease